VDEAGLTLSWWQLFGLGVLGGVFAELASLRPYMRRTRKTWPQALKEPLYWVFVALWIVVGGVAAVFSLLGVSGYGWWMPTQIGMTAPLLLERLGASLPDNPVGRVG